ncbi:M56 family metallopeptidase [Clostridium sp.]|uniref:M56 family metallopeptidase n=1 Tax=Clostridium sp. TaxID=1506 RepID=UPI0025C4FB25|nr:M56 family metallopeptidase [Clostridium sp.]
MFRYVVSLSLSASIVVIGLLLIKILLRRKLSANWQYYIWVILFIRLTIPFIPSTPLNVFNYIPYNQQVSELTQISMPSIKWKTSVAIIQPNKNTVNIANEAPSSNESVRNSAVPFAMSWFNWQTSALVWLIGVTVIFLYILFVNLMLLFKNRKLTVCVSDDILRIVHECKTILKLNSNVSVVYGDSLKSPGLLGIFHPKIIISPEIIKKLSSGELRYIFLHELSHLKRRDLLVNAMVLTIQVIYWFNPLTWYALSQMKLDCEMACDAEALGTLKPEEQKKYGQTIISLLQMLSEPYWAPGTIGFVGKFNTRRIIMISTCKKTTKKWAIVALSLILLVGCSSINSPLIPKSSTKNQAASTTKGQPDNDTNPSTSSSSTTTNSSTISYKNTQYGFNFTLPKSWQGFSIITGIWEGNDAASGKVTKTGPMISIRHPQWNSKKPRQDIPIMVFTLDQWNLLRQDKFHIGAAPFGPSELGRNNYYVFALPARYNFAYPTGYQEVEEILKTHPLKVVQIVQSTDSKTVMLLNMMQLAKQGKIINCDFPAKTATIGTIIKAWGKADKTVYVASAKGSYATYTKHNIVFGINKGDQVFEVRSFDTQLKDLSLAKVKEVFGTPAFDSKTGNQEIIGYTAGTEFKFEMVFSLPTSANPSPVMDHYNVLYPSGTVNSMAGDSGRQW